MMHQVILSFGSNVSPRGSKIAMACLKLGSALVVSQMSPMIETDDFTGRGAPYLNAVAKCYTDMELKDLQVTISELERSLGRTPLSKSSAEMPIDIDVVMVDGVIVSADDYNRPYFRQLYDMVKD